MSTKPAPAVSPEPGAVTVLVTSSGGTWGRGPDLAAAWKNAHPGARHEVVIKVFPAAAKPYVDGMGCVCWTDPTSRPDGPMHGVDVANPDPVRLARKPGATSWPARRTAALLAAVDRAIVDVRAR